MRKKIISMLLLVSIATICIGCGSNNNSTLSNNNDSNNDSVQKVQDSTDKSGELSKNSKQFEQTTTPSGDNITKVDKLVRIYLYNGDTDKIVYFDENVSVTDGALVSAIIDDLKKDRTSEFCPLSKDVAVKSAKLDKENDLLTVNFGDKFVNTMGFGSGPESSVLTSVVNTLGYNFGVSKVYITVSGKPYSSGHIIKKEGEAFTVEYKDTAPK